MKKKVYTTLNHRKMNKTSCASLVNRIKTNADGLDSREWQNDELFMALWIAMLEIVSDYQEPIGKVRKKRITNSLANAELIRYRAYQAFKRANNVYAVSEVAAEKAACKLIKDQLKALKIKIQNNKENKTTNYNVLVAKLRSTGFIAQVELLKLTDFVSRLEAANNTFSTTEHTGVIEKIRANETAIVATRDELLNTYQLVINYVQAMVALDKEPFIQLFGAIDEAREYFARDMAYRDTLKKNKKTKSATDATPKVG